MGLFDAHQVETYNTCCKHITVLCCWYLMPSVTCLLCRCLEGCTCAVEDNVDALHNLRQSTIFLVRLLVSQHPRCVIGITVLEETSSGEHKFKVTCLMKHLDSASQTLLNWLCCLNALLVV